MTEPQAKELILRPWEHDAGGLLAVATAVERAVNSDLREVWAKAACEDAD